MFFFIYHICSFTQNHIRYEYVGVFFPLDYLIIFGTFFRAFYGKPGKCKCLTACAVGPVTEVKTDIFVTSFGPVSDVEMVCKQASQS